LPVEEKKERKRKADDTPHSEKGKKTLRPRGAGRKEPIVEVAPFFAVKRGEKKGRGKGKRESSNPPRANKSGGRNIFGWMKN